MLHIIFIKMAIVWNIKNWNVNGQNTIQCSVSVRTPNPCSEILSINYTTLHSFWLMCTPWVYRWIIPTFHHIVAFEIKGQIHQQLNCLWILVCSALTVHGRSGGGNEVELCSCVHERGVNGCWSALRRGWVGKECAYIEGRMGRDEETREQCMKLHI